MQQHNQLNISHSYKRNYTLYLNHTKLRYFIKGGKIAKFVGSGNDKDGYCIILSTVRNSKDVVKNLAIFCLIV